MILKLEFEVKMEPTKVVAVLLILVQVLNVIMRFTIVDTKRKLFTKHCSRSLHFLAPDTTMMARSRTTMVLDKTT